jgi:hypothetical protein
MTDIKIELVDMDYVIRAKTNLGWMNNDDNELKKFFRDVDEELVAGKTAHLEIKGLKKDPVTFEISKVE